MELDNLRNVVDSLTAGASSLGTCLHDLQLVLHLEVYHG